MDDILKPIFSAECLLEKTIKKEKNPHNKQTISVINIFSIYSNVSPSSIITRNSLQFICNP